MFAGRKLPLTLVFVAVVAIVIGVSCKGFFVDPTLTSIAVGPATPTIPLTTGSPPTNTTKQFTAVGTFSDGSTGSTPVTWTATSTAGTTVATIDSSSGLATAQAVGTATITATSTKNPTISGNTTLTVVPANVTSITVTPSSQSTTTSAGFTLTAKDQNGNDISTSVTWTFSVSGTTETGITGTAGSSGGETFTIGTLNPPQTPQYTLSIVAKLTVGSTTTTSNTVTVTVTS
jgi:hypothetical protein